MRKLGNHPYSSGISLQIKNREIYGIEKVEKLTEIETREQRIVIGQELTLEEFQI